MTKDPLIKSFRFYSVIMLMIVAALNARGITIDGDVLQSLQDNITEVVKYSLEIGAMVAVLISKYREAKK